MEPHPRRTAPWEDDRPGGPWPDRSRRGVRALASGRVLAFDPLSDPDFDLRHGIGRLGFEELLAESDVVSLHLPLTKVTHGLFNRDVLARMRRPAAKRPRSGHLAGAGLDVLNSEPPEPGNPLLQLPNVVISPHVAGIDTKSMSDMAVLAAQCVVALHQGQWPAGCVVNDEPGTGCGRRNEEFPEVIGES